MKVVAFKCDNCCAVTEIPVNKAIRLIIFNLAKKCNYINRK